MRFNQQTQNLEPPCVQDNAHHFEWSLLSTSLTDSAKGPPYPDDHIWDDHIQMISKKGASGISAIKRVRNFVPHETLPTINRALVQPHFNYCSAVWGNCN